jgi:hypothetical protein
MYGRKKMQQVLLGNMDPKEVGVADLKDIPIIGEQPAQPDPTKLRALKGPNATPKMGDRVEFIGSVVPLRLRAEWEKQDSKIIPFDIEGWMAEHKDEYRIQTMAAIGNGIIRLDQTFSDPVLGLCEMMEKTAAEIRTKYEELKKSAEQPVEGQTILHTGQE